jgi:hypothetical protein
MKALDGAAMIALYGIACASWGYGSLLVVDPCGRRESAINTSCVRRWWYHYTRTNCYRCEWFVCKFDLWAVAPRSCICPASGTVAGAGHSKIDVVITWTASSQNNIASLTFVENS